MHGKLGRGGGREKDGEGEGGGAEHTFYSRSSNLMQQNFKYGQQNVIYESEKK